MRLIKKTLDTYMSIIKLRVKVNLHIFRFSEVIWFNGISNLEGYLMLNSLYTYRYD